jgi:3',5'-cyclic AMP phosphodiesterase CpdA
MCSKFILIAILAFCTQSLLANDTLIYFAQSTTVPGSSWKYLDNNTNLDAINWKDSTYNDGSWATGNSELGYGDGDENTIVNDGCTPQGSNCATKHITTYFRKTFFVNNPAVYTSFTVQYKRDDGIEIFINGIRYEINNLVDPVLNTTLATAAGDDGETIFSVSIPTTAFYGNGRKNVIAVDIHQTLQSSSDVTFDLQLIGNTNAALTRGPYLQTGKQDSITIRWRTDVATDSKITWGTVFGTYPFFLTDATLTTEHIVRIGGLNADTKYFYTIGGTAFTLQATNSNYFLTLPPNNTTRKLRFIAVGDCGNASPNQINVKNTYLNYIGANNTDAMILLGDNAYSFGLDAEYQAEFFDIYKDDLLKNIKLYPAPGNHDYGNSQANATDRNNDYYKNFTMPIAGEIGGVASGTEAYYSFNIGNVHFVSLDSYGKENANTTRLYDTTGAQVVWLKNDLTANTQRWTVVYFHHPPYTKTSHTSDVENELVLMRENFIRILERFGVDLVLCGHSHGYERSYLLKNYYNSSAAPIYDADFNVTNHTATGTFQNAMYDGTALSCPYVYNSGKYNHGTIYTVAGSAGQLGGTTAGYPHDAMFYSNQSNGGLLYFEVDNNRLDAKFISYTTAPTPVIRDQFTIMKDVNKVTDITVLPNTVTTLSSSWVGNYFWPTNGSTSSSITIPTNVLGIFNYIVTDAASNGCLKDSFRVVISSALPISLQFFGITKTTNNIIQLNWQIYDNNNAANYFNIEKSYDGINFSFYKKVMASNRLQNYQWNDLDATTGTIYYKLTLVERSGAKSVLGVRKVKNEIATSFNYSILVQNQNTVQLSITDVSTGLYQVSVYNSNGSRVIYKRIGAMEQFNLSKGTYGIVIKKDKGKIIKGKFVVL